MSLRGNNAGGIWHVLPSIDLDGEYTVLVRAKRGATADSGDKLISVQNAAATKGFYLQLSNTTEGGANGTTAPVFIAATGTTSWGNNANQASRGMGVSGAALSTDRYDTLIGMFRGQNSPSFTGTAGSGTTQIHNAWHNGVPMTLSQRATSVVTQTTAEARMQYCYRALATGTYFDGWLADIVIWQGFLSESDRLLIANPNVDLSTVSPATQKLRRTFRVDLTGAPEVENAAYGTAQGTAPVWDADNPVALPTASGSSTQTTDDVTASGTGTVTSAPGVVGSSTATTDEISGTGEGAVTGVGGFAEPTFDRPFGGGDVALPPTITNGTTADPTITFQGDPELNDTFTAWEHLDVEIDLKQTGRRPTIRIDFSSHRLGAPYAVNRGYWRYKGEGRHAWRAFDNRSVSGAILTVSNNTAFAQAIVEVATAPPIRYGELKAWLNGLAVDARVKAPKSSLFPAATDYRKFAIFAFPDANSPDGIRVWDTVDNRPIYSFAWVIGDSATAPGIYDTWMHAGEAIGLRCEMDHHDAILAGTAAGNNVVAKTRRMGIVINTGGLVGGMARGTPEAGDVGNDPNRCWPNNVAATVYPADDPIPSVEAAIAAIKNEFGTKNGLIDCEGEIAWHGRGIYTATDFWAWDAPRDAGAVPAPTLPSDVRYPSRYFGDRVRLHYAPGVGDFGSSDTAGTSRHWTYRATRSRIWHIFEFAYTVADMVERSQAFGIASVAALSDTIDAGFLNVSTGASAITTDEVTASGSGVVIPAGTAIGMSTATTEDVIAIGAGTVTGTGFLPATGQSVVTTEDVIATAEGIVRTPVPRKLTRGFRVTAVR